MTDGGRQIQVVQVRGELDLTLADSLAVRGYAAIGRQARVLLLDLAGVSFCDACGLSALVRIANHADRTGCRYGLIAPQPPVVKVLRITGLDQRPGLIGGGRDRRDDRQDRRRRGPGLFR